MKYSYVGRNLYGLPTQGEISADSVDDARRMLHDRGIYPLHIVEQKSAKNPLLKRVSSSQLANFAKEMSVMARAGIPQDMALRTLERQAEGTYFGDILHEVRTDVSSGISLSAALSKHPRIFDTIFVSIVRSGEESGAIDQAFSNLSEFIKKQNQIKGKVISALIYPMMIMTFAIVGSLFLLIVVFPRLEDLYSSLGGDLPAITRAVLGFRTFLVTYWYLIVSGMGFGIYTLNKWMKSAQGKRWRDRKLSRVPMIGPFLQKMAIIRFAKTLSSLVVTGTNITVALEIAGKSSGNTLIEDAVSDIIDGLRQGETMQKRMKKYERVFLPMLVNLFGTGEQIGQIDEMLNHASMHYESEIDETASRLSSILDPILMVVMIFILGFILMALYMPVFQMSSLLS